MPDIIPDQLDDEILVRTVTLKLCGPCLDGEGDECHTPGCSLWMHPAPGIPIRDSQGVTIHPEPRNPPADWVDGADPSWFPRVLRVLQRDWPEIADQAWDRAITENAAEIEQRKAAPLHLPSGGERVENTVHRLLGIPGGL